MSSSFLRNAAFVFALAFSANAAADVITLRADEWCPYNCAPDSKQPGIMVEIAKKVFEAAGHKVDYQVLNWARAIEDTRAGKFNGIIGAAQRDAQDFVFPEEELGKSVTAFVVRKDDKWGYKGTESLRNRTLGTIRNYSYSEGLDAYIEKNKGDEKKVQVISGDNPLEINLRKLQRGHIDTVLDGDWVLKYTVASLKLEKEVRFAGVESNGDSVYIAFAPKNPKSKDYAKLLSDGVAKMRASGELKEILAKYGLSDWK